MSELKHGTPPPVFLPAREHEWLSSDGPYEVTITIGESEVAFDVAADVTVWLSFSRIVKTISEQGKFPRLADNEFFSIADVLVDQEGQTLTIIGFIIRK